MRAVVGLESTARFVGYVALAFDLGVLEAVGPGSDLPRAALGERFES